MLRGLTEVPQPACSPASQPLSRPASRAQREGEHSCLSRPPLSSTIYSIDSPCGIFPLWRGIICEHTSARYHTIQRTDRHRPLSWHTHAHTFTHLCTDATHTKTEHTHLHHCGLRSIARGDIWDLPLPPCFSNIFIFLILWSCLLSLCCVLRLLLQSCFSSNYRACQWARAHKEYLWCYNYFAW